MLIKSGRVKGVKSNMLFISEPLHNQYPGIFKLVEERTVLYLLSDMHGNGAGAEERNIVC